MEQEECRLFSFGNRGGFQFLLMPNVTFPARFDFLDEIREFVAQVAREGGFTDKEIYSLQLAADEAASNIIEHAYKGISNAVIDITCDMHGDTLTITMWDTGKSFNPSKVKQPNLKADLSDRQIGGLAYTLCGNSWTKSAMNPIQTGNLLTMTKRVGINRMTAAASIERPQSWDWRQLASLGEQLRNEDSLSAQRDRIVAMTSSLIKGKVDVWLNENVFRLPDWEEGRVFPLQPPMAGMKTCHQTGKTFYTDWKRDKKHPSSKSTGQRLTPDLCLRFR